jgi:hypothetical protein
MGPKKIIVSETPKSSAKTPKSSAKSGQLTIKQLTKKELMRGISERVEDLRKKHVQMGKSLLDLTRGVKENVGNTNPIEKKVQDRNVKTQPKKQVTQQTKEKNVRSKKNKSLPIDVESTPS